VAEILKIAFPPLAPGELFESWLLWFCHVNHDQTAWLIRDLGVEDAVIRGACLPDRAFEVLHEMSEIEVGDLQASHLHSFARTLGLAYSSRFMIPIGSVRAGHVPFKYCPECWLEDERPFVRLTWALEMTAFCPVHRQALLMNCQHCAKPLQLKLRDPVRIVTACVSCQKDGRVARAPQAVPETVLRFQQNLLSLRCDDHWEFDSHRPLTALRFVAIIQQLLWALKAISMQPALMALRLESLNTLGLQHDQFSWAARSTNAVLLCAWFAKAPQEHANEILEHVCSPGFFDPTGQLLTMAKAFRRALHGFEQAGWR
jgi:TniQ